MFTFTTLLLVSVISFVIGVVIGASYILYVYESTDDD